MVAPHPRERRPCGTWASPITAEIVARGAVGFGQLWFDGRRVFFTEGRPTEGGRTVLVQRDEDGRFTDVTPPGFNVRTRVHEYGGGDYLVTGDAVFFSNYADQRVYRQDRGSSPKPITGDDALRFADPQLDHARRRIVCIREDKRRLESREDVNSIVALDLDAEDQSGRVLVAGNDFYASPRVSPDGRRMAWLTWNHPNMPWDAAELWVAALGDDGNVADPVHVAGGAGESIFQPEWSPDGTLHFVSDRTGFWNLYRLRGGAIEPLCPRSAEFGLPQWVFGQSTYAFVSNDVIVCTYTEGGIWRLAKLDTAGRELVPVPTPYTWFSGIRGASGGAVFVAGAPTEPSAVVRFDVRSDTLQVLRRSTELSFDAGDLAVPQFIEFPAAGGAKAYAFHYRPTNRRYAPPTGEKPPLLVKCHGGPTGAASSLFSLPIQFWTSRGFAVLDVNYGGSTGFGRAYRERLRGQWGVVDVDDCASAALHLVAAGQADPERVAIAGGSAGGFTVLCALTWRDVFRAGASHFGIGDLERLAEDARTGHHKFESRYEEALVGPYPERADVYRERSPLQHAKRLRRPVIFFQGLDDRIVLPNQAERMVGVLRQNRLPVAYLSFAGEGHGFRRAETIKRVLEAEFYFYSRIFGFTPADEIEPVPIDNLP
jgi:dipeptidyl aminopeptidase/acylaminoacyl peptidase